ncbi:DegV family protein [Clostridium sp. CM028]|uniref:DegV family protein n=1 Tax=unclassified Clostridium TaxID=2614128 RepID=UPI001C0BD078|nr:MULTISPECIES: DegV family protein [unclassified Clostridium]MBU3090811.1 DegV family protein [Clostridium sp. CF011]MBW9144624.1 DegV family protein [Clostridium sp. CM027]MBW9147850.1 DegV family protein [Clostridium sp. CM028]UVE40619.1 DegV family protein [Clostridium sp. CM027]WAG69585.1 DegV family protein [Clostridium sp. CF011]
MEKIKIITDSTCDLNKDIIDKYNIEVLPLLVNIENKTYRDGEDISLQEYLYKMNNSEQFPVTTQVNPHRFYECYKKYLDEGYKIVSIHLSSKMSGTYQSSCMAKSMLSSEDIITIDSYNVTSGLGILVLKACKLKEEGCNIFEIEEKVKQTIPHVKSALAFDSLNNLVKGGRLSKTAGAIGGLLGIKLILTVKDGEMAVIDKVRGSKKAIKTILKNLEQTGTRSGETSILLQASDRDILGSLRSHMSEREMDFIECSVGCVVGTHAGEGACGIFYVEEY